METQVTQMGLLQLSKASKSICGDSCNISNYSIQLLSEATTVQESFKAFTHNTGLLC